MSAGGALGLSGESSFGGCSNVGDCIISSAALRQSWFVLGTVVAGAGFSAGAGVVAGAGWAGSKSISPASSTFTLAAGGSSRAALLFRKGLGTSGATADGAAGSCSMIVGSPYCVEQGYCAKSPAFGPVAPISGLVAVEIAVGPAGAASDGFFAAPQ